MKIFKLQHKVYRNCFKVIKAYTFSVIFLAMNIGLAGASEAESKTILAFGDSLIAGYGLNAEDGFSHQLEKTLNQQGLKVRVINAGLSGDTTSAGLSRLEWVLSAVNNGRPDLVIVELGANDALRGVPPKIARDNLDSMLALLSKAKLKVLLTGMMAPPNLGLDYSNAFNPMYAELAKKHDATLYPFFLDGVAAKIELNQEDGMHPNPQGVRIIVGKITPYILEIFKK